MPRLPDAEGCGAALAQVLAPASVRAWGSVRERTWFGPGSKYPSGVADWFALAVSAREAAPDSGRALDLELPSVLEFVLELALDFLPEMVLPPGY